MLNSFGQLCAFLQFGEQWADVLFAPGGRRYSIVLARPRGASSVPFGQTDGPIAPPPSGL